MSTVRQSWLTRLDKFSAISGALVPTGLVLGNTAFEGLVGLAGLSWLLRSILAYIWGEPGVRQSFAMLARHPLVMPYFVWYLVIVTSVLCNVPNMDKLSHDFIFIRHLFFVAAAMEISQRVPVFKYFLYGLAGGILLAGLNTLAVHLLGYDLIGNSLSHYINKRQQAPRIAHLAAFSAPFFWGWALALEQKQFNPTPLLLIERRSILVSLTLIAVTLALMSDIRTYILGMVAGLVLVFILSGRKDWLKNLILLVGVMTVVGVLFSQMGRFQNLTSIHHRFYIWKVSWLMSLDHPIIGVSVSAYKEIFRQYASIDLATAFNLPTPSAPQWSGYHAHNLLLMVLTVTGITGLITFLWLLVNAIRLAFRSRETKCGLGLASWVAVFLAIGVVGTNIYGGATAALFVFFLGLIGSRDNYDSFPGIGAKKTSD